MMAANNASWAETNIWLTSTAAITANCTAMSATTAAACRLSEPMLPRRFRVPDVCVVTEKPEGEPGHRIVTMPPYLCIEILSPEDSAVETLEKVREYLNFGVNWVWVIDPVSRAGQVHGRKTVASVEDRIFSTDRFSIDLPNAEF